MLLGWLRSAFRCVGRYILHNEEEESEEWDRRRCGIFQVPWLRTAYSRKTNIGAVLRLHVAVVASES